MRGAVRFCLLVAVCGACLAGPKEVRFGQSSDAMAVYDFVEVTLAVERPDADNPFVDVAVTGQVTPEGGQPVKVEGFCDSEDGTLYRIRFMAQRPGKYSWEATYSQGDFVRTHRGGFTAEDKGNKGIVRVDPAHPFHFICSGDGSHFFWNSTTTYWLLGWRDKSIIRESLERLARLKVNRVRVALSGRTHDGMRWKEPDVKPNEAFQFRLEPWPAQRPTDIENPGYDVQRFNVAHFRTCERMLARARELGIQVSLIFHLDGRDKGVDPFGEAQRGGPDEERYYRYSVARFAAYANVMWDVTNEWHLFRDEAWVERMGALIAQCDPYDHMISVHGRGDFPFRTSPWCDFAMYQCWDEHGGYPFMLQNRRQQEQTGRPMPQVNEEYGYEDHYPYPWGEGRKWPARVADNRRRLAWEMTMAGGYQTTGERANVPGYGGWITGRGGDEMRMLEGYARMAEFFTSTAWWRCEPAPDVVSQGALCLAERGRLYLVYLPSGGRAEVSLDGGRYRGRLFNPRDGRWTELGKVEGGRWRTPECAGGEDWAVVLTREGDGGRQ